jgi:hypothetical protein
MPRFVSPAWLKKEDERLEAHEWVPAPNRSWDMCAKCGFIRRDDGRNKPCKGPIPVGPR